MPTGAAGSMQCSALSIGEMPNSSFVRRLQVLATLLEPTRRRLYRYVSDQFDAVSRDRAARAVGVSRAMAAFHLDKLVESGLLRAAYRRLSGRTGRGAGRPAKLYRRSRRRFDVMVPQRQHELLARLLAESIDRADMNSADDDAAHAFGRSLGVRGRRRIPTNASPENVARCVEDVMANLGFEPIRTGAGEVRAANCPFDPLSRRMPTVVCHTAIALLRGVVAGTGAADLRVSRDERAPWCCVVLGSASPSAELPSDVVSRYS
jgi:predicted ArsR family transcriptional regulator